MPLSTNKLIIESSCFSSPKEHLLLKHRNHSKPNVPCKQVIIDSTALGVATLPELHDITTTLPSPFVHQTMKNLTVFYHPFSLVNLLTLQTQTKHHFN